MRRAWILGLVLCLLVAGCVPAGTQNNATVAPAATATTLAAATNVAPATPAVATVASAAATGTGAAASATPLAPGATAAALPSGEFQDPVIASDFPDPDVIQSGHTFYAYATNAAGKNIQAARSSDLVHWEMLPDAMPVLAPWTQPTSGLVWAPGVIQLGNKYLMYYTARDQKSDRQCIGVAASDKPAGPFKDGRAHALVCQAEQGGSIDAQPFQDGNKLYLYWKNDGNCCAMTVNLYVQELSADGMSLVGQPKSLTQADQGWEGPLIEAPFMVKHDGRYYLFFSANRYDTADYAEGYATCDTATGPCQQAADNPVLKTRYEDPPVLGPGGASLLQVGDQTWMVYHAWNVVGGGRGDSRFMWLERVDWQNGKPAVHGPTTGPQPDPPVGP